MRTVDEQPETIHLYVVREAAPKPSLLPIFLSFIALSLVIAIGVLSPNQQPVTRAVIRVPAVPLTTKTFIAQTPVIPTGVRTYPATTAHGTLTITNGSVISQTLPARLILLSNSGIQVATDTAVFVPSGSANGYGMTTVAAHLLSSGINMSTLSVNQILGTSLYVRNLQPFTGGHPAYSVKVTTRSDRQVALNHARLVVAAQINGLHYPCKEFYLSEPKRMRATWHCQLVTYHIPAFYHVTRVKIIGKNLLLDVWFVARPVHIWVK